MPSTRLRDGVEGTTRRSTPGVRRGSLADCFGHRAIKRALRERGLKVARAEFANSSLGRLFDDRFLKCFRESIFGSPVDDGRLSIVWPTADVAMRMEWDDILQRHDLDAVADGIVFIPCSSA